MIAVAAIAIAPQNATLPPPTQGDAPPVRAASAPSAPRQRSEAPETISESWARGERITTNSGSAAPIANVAADAAAAKRTSGHLFGNSKFVPRVRCKRVVRHQLHGDCAGKLWIETPPHVNVGEFFFFCWPLGPQLPSLCSEVSLFRVGLRPYRYVFTGCH